MFAQRNNNELVKKDQHPEAIQVKCIIKNWDVQFPTHKQLSKKQMYDPTQENCLLRIV